MGKTKRGKGTKIMAVADRTGLPIAISIGSASPHEVTLVETTLEARFTEDQPERLIGDKAYDSDPLDERLNDQGIQMIAPHKSNRKKAKTQDGRPLRRYRKRWKIERLFAWLLTRSSPVTRSLDSDSSNTIEGFDPSTSTRLTVWPPMLVEIWPQS